MIDVDLAALYRVTTQRLNEQVKRNADRFPGDFMFRLSAAEKTEVVATCDHLARLKFSKALPYACTEHGAIQAAHRVCHPAGQGREDFRRSRQALRQAPAIGTRWCRRVLETVTCPLPAIPPIKPKSRLQD